MRQSLARAIWNHRWFYIFISPFFILFAIFGLYPLLFSLYMSTLDWDGLREPVHIGARNFSNLFHDDLFFTSLKNTVLLGLYHAPIMLLLVFGFALLLNQQWIRLRAFWRAAVFIPCITPMVVIAIVFYLLFSSEFGLVNDVLRAIARRFGSNFNGVLWLDSEAMSKITVSLLLIWRWTGYNMVIMLAGLQGIPHDIYEAATIDGASRWQQLWRMTAPLMIPTFTFCLITSLIGTVYMFDEVFVLTRGGPGTSSLNFGVFLFDLSFQDFRLGYASAAAYSVATVVVVLTLLIYRWAQKATE